VLHRDHIDFLCGGELHSPLNVGICQSHGSFATKSSAKSDGAGALTLEDLQSFLQ
jgi:hypothetical protein